MDLLSIALTRPATFCWFYESTDCALIMLLLYTTA
jgi:hypothetical protein